MKTLNRKLKGFTAELGFNFITWLFIVMITVPAAMLTKLRG